MKLKQLSHALRLLAKEMRLLEKWGKGPPSSRTLKVNEAEFSQVQSWLLVSPGFCYNFLTPFPKTSSPPKCVSLRQEKRDWF